MKTIDKTNSTVGANPRVHPWTQKVNNLIIAISSILIFSIFLISCSDNEASSSNICDNNPCAQSPVAHKTVCELVGSSTAPTDFQCVCEEGYEDDNGACKWIELDPCDPNPCVEEHKTVCIPEGDNMISGEGDNMVSPVRCQCDSGFIDNDGKCEEVQATQIRIMAANITSGRKQSYKANAIRMFQALKPDIILIQEFNYLDEWEDESLPLRDLVDIAFGTEFNFFEGVGRIPNGIITRYPIIESGNWDDSSIDDREIAYAKIKLPNNKFLWAISVHLSTQNNLTGARDAIAAIKAKNIPSEDYIVFGGDFNTKSRTTGTINVLGELFNVLAPYPAGYNSFSDHDTCFKCYVNYEPDECGDKFNCDPTATSYERDDPYDWIIADKNNLHSLQVPSVYCSENSKTDCLTFEHGMVFDSRDFTQEELNKYFPPVLIGDCDRCIVPTYGDDEAYYREGCDRENNDDYMNFQHMGVIKDFLIPN